jgi:hypothetical protein
MTRRAAVVVAVVALIAWVTWTLVPAFPAPDTPMAISLAALTQHLGTPSMITSGSFAPSPLAFPNPHTVVWEKSRGFGVWSIRADWRSNRKDFLGHPDSISRCFRIKWTPERASFCRVSIWLDD